MARWTYKEILRETWEVERGERMSYASMRSKCNHQEVAIASK